MANDDSTKFHLEKASASLFEVGKRIENATFLFLLVSTVAILVTFSGEGDAALTLPVINFELSRWKAASFAALMCAASWLRIVVLLHMHGILLGYTIRLLSEANYQSTHFHLKYPSIIGILADTKHEGKRGDVLFNILVSGMIIMGVLGPVGIHLAVRLRSGHDPFWFTTCVLSVVVVLIGLFIMFALTKNASNSKLVDESWD